ncbi:MAG: hypothetical protein U0931_02030 [Vulcanimicrobiota bacterium]
MAILAMILILLSQWFGWATWRRVCEARLRPRILVGQSLCSVAQLCLLAWVAAFEHWLPLSEMLANADGGLLAQVGLWLQLGGLWLLFWLTTGLVLAWRLEGSRDRKSTAFTLTTTLVSHTLLTVVGPLGAVEWVLRNFH